MDSVIGIVVEIDLLTTKLKTPDTKKVFMPNWSLMQSSIINHSACASRRIEVVVSVSHDDDIEEAEAVLRRVIAQQPFYASTPEASVGVNTRGDFGQNILV